MLFLKMLTGNTEHNKGGRGTRREEQREGTGKEGREQAAD